MQMRGLPGLGRLHPLTLGAWRGKLCLMAEYSKVDSLDLEEAAYSTVLAEDIEFDGYIDAAEPLLIKGKVSGKISASSNLLIEKDAVVNADIKARNVVIKGKVKGNVSAEKIVWVLGTGSLAGDIASHDVVLDTGCFFSGSCTMTRDGA